MYTTLPIGRSKYNMTTQKKIMSYDLAEGFLAASKIQNVYLKYRLRKIIIETQKIIIEKYYSPGGPGYHKAFKNFESVYVNYMSR